MAETAGAFSIDFASWPLASELAPNSTPKVIWRYSEYDLI
jgi:hypothetical protein